MPDAERCELTDLEVTGCAHCRGITGQTPYYLTVGYRFTAKFTSRCPVCDRGIAEGDQMAKTVDGEYICERCANA
jgi:hypothetical protein